MNINHSFKINFPWINYQEQSRINMLTDLEMSCQINFQKCGTHSCGHKQGIRLLNDM